MPDASSPSPYLHRVSSGHRVTKGRPRHDRIAGIGSNPGRAAAPEPASHAAQNGLSEELKIYAPTRADYDAGWWLNNAILHKMGLKKLGADGCSWIKGHPSDSDWSYCGEKRAHGKVYCDAHVRASYVKPPPPQPKKDKYDGQ